MGGDVRVVVPGCSPRGQARHSFGWQVVLVAVPGERPAGQHEQVPHPLKPSELPSERGVLVVDGVAFDGLADLDDGSGGVADPPDVAHLDGAVADVGTRVPHPMVLPVHDQAEVLGMAAEGLVEQLYDVALTIWRGVVLAQVERLWWA